jgi:hypothetical protein
LASSIPAAVAEAVNDNTAAATPAAAYDPAPLYADPGAATGAANLPAVVGADLAQAIVAQLQPTLDQVVVNTGQTARTLDDVAQGGDSFRTAAA